MALYTITSDAEALNASTAETLLQAVAGTKPLRLVRWAVSFNGADATKSPGRVELLRLSSSGTSSAFTPLALNPQTEAAIFTARTSHTAEPTAGDILERYFCTPAGGLLMVQYGYDERPVVAPNGRLGIRVNFPDAVNVSSYMVFEE